MVKKSFDTIMHTTTPELNSCTCQWMYQRNASLDHLPISMLVNTGTCTGKIHGHGGSRMDGVSTHVHCLDTKFLFANCCDYGWLKARLTSWLMLAETDFHPSP